MLPIWIDTAMRAPWEVGGDVAETRCGEHGQAEVERVDAGELLVEAAGVVLGEQEIGGGEGHDVEARQGDQHFHRCRHRVFGPDEVAYLVGAERGEQYCADEQADDVDVAGLVDRQTEIADEQQHCCGEWPHQGLGNLAPGRAVDRAECGMRLCTGEFGVPPGPGLGHQIRTRSASSRYSVSPGFTSKAS